MNHVQKGQLVMSLNSSLIQQLLALSLDGSTTFLKQDVNRRTFVKALIGLAIIDVEGELVACGSENKIVSSVPEGIELFTYYGHTDWVFAARWSPRSQYIASGGADQTVQVWNAVNGKLQSTYHHQSLVSAIAWSPDGNYVASGGDNGVVKVWDTTGSTKKPVSMYDVGAKMWGLEWSPDGKFLAASDMNAVKLYDTSNKKEKLKCISDAGYVWNVAWSPDGRYIASACQNNKILIFDIEKNGYNKSSFNLHKGRVWGVDWSPDGRYIASGGDDNKIVVCEAKDGSVVFSGEHTDRIYGVYGVAWSPDGTYVTSAGQDGLAKVWSVGNKSNVVSYNGHSGPLFRNSWAPEGKRIVTGYKDGTVQVWRLPDL